MSSYSVSLASTSNYGKVADTSLSGGFTNFSMSVWFKGTNAGGTMLIGCYQFSPVWGGMVLANGGSNKLLSQLLNNTNNSAYNYNSAVTTWLDGNWHSLIVTYDSVAGAKFYFDGTDSFSSSSGTIPGTAYATSTPFAIGDDNVNYTTFVGKYAYPLFYKRTLTPTEAATIAAHGSVSGAEAQWLFTEGTGFSAADSSGNSHTLTFNAVSWSTDVPFQPSAPPPTVFSGMFFSEI